MSMQPQKKRKRSGASGRYTGKSSTYYSGRTGGPSMGNISYSAPMSEIKYVDGYRDDGAIHELSSTLDDTWADTEINPRQQTGTYGCLPVPRQGTNYADRDGRRIIMKNIKIRGTLSWGAEDSAAGPSTRSAVRLVVVKDTRTNGASLSAENVIGPGLGSDGQATISGNGAALMLLTNPDGWGRYQIVHDEVIEAPPQSAYGDATVDAGNTLGVIKDFKINVKCNQEVNFSDTTGAVGSIIDNSYHMLAAAVDTDVGPRIAYYARTAFVG